MKTVERIIIKLIITQIIFLFLAQWLLLHSGFAPYINRLYEYEGIINGQSGDTLETIDRSKFLWYDSDIENDTSTSNDDSQIGWIK